MTEPHIPRKGFAILTSQQYDNVETLAYYQKRYYNIYVQDDKAIRPKLRWEYKQTPDVRDKTMKQNEYDSLKESIKSCRIVMHEGMSEDMVISVKNDFADKYIRKILSSFGIEVKK
jgi:hypothetical protein